MFHQQTQEGPSQEGVSKDYVFATDDEWVSDEVKVEMIRVHRKMREGEVRTQGWTQPHSIGVPGQ